MQRTGSCYLRHLRAARPWHEGRVWEGREGWPQPKCCVRPQYEGCRRWRCLACSCCWQQASTCFAFWRRRCWTAAVPAVLPSTQGACGRRAHSCRTNDACESETLRTGAPAMWMAGQGGLLCLLRWRRGADGECPALRWPHRRYLATAALRLPVIHALCHHY
jgi:hypothetical protein